MTPGITADGTIPGIMVDGTALIIAIGDIPMDMAVTTVDTMEVDMADTIADIKENASIMEDVRRRTATAQETAVMAAPAQIQEFRPVRVKPADTTLQALAPMEEVADIPLFHLPVAHLMFIAPAEVAQPAIHHLPIIPV